MINPFRLLTTINERMLWTMNALTDLDAKADAAVASVTALLAHNASVLAELTAALADKVDPAAVQAIANKLQTGVIDPANAAVTPPAA